MALTNLSSSNTIYLTVAEGCLVRQFKEANANTAERVTKTGKLVHEVKYRDLNAMLTGIETKENDYGKQWVIKFNDGEVNYYVNLPYSSRYSSSFLKTLPNIDLSKLVKFMPWSMKDKNDASKIVTGITCYQDGIKIAPAFTKENPNGLPEMCKIKVKGKETWDDSDMMDYLEKLAVDCFKKIANAPSNDEGNEDAPF